MEKSPVWIKWIMRLFVLCGVAAAGLSALKLESIFTAADTHLKRPNLLLITLDNLRLDHLNIYGYSRDTSPSIKALAKEATIFENAFTVSTNSGPSHATILTGLYPIQHGLVDNGQKIHADTPTLAGYLKKNDYETAGFVGYYALSEESNLHNGFQTFEYHKIKNHEHEEKTIEDDLLGFRATQGWLEKHVQKSQQNPFFVWMHVQNIHESYDPPPPYNSLFGQFSNYRKFDGFDGKFDIRCANDLADAWRSGVLPSGFEKDVIALYDGEIKLVDDYLKKIFSTLRSAGVYDNTVIAVLADHGEVLFESYEHEFYKMGPGHTARYSDAAIRIPLIIKPAKPLKKTPSFLSEMVSTIDLVPTLIELMGLQPPKFLPGKSLVPLMQNGRGNKSYKEVILHEKPYGVEYTVLRTRDWKFVHKNAEDIEGSLLIDLKNDPLENRNMTLSHPAKVDEMRTILAKWKSDKKSSFTSSDIELSVKMRKALKAGGYIKDE
jgi:arylsulfatase A-like enzyme